MSTVTQEPQPHGEMLDYEQYIDHQLRLTRSRIKMTDVLTASVALISAVLATLFLEVLLDHAIGLPRLVRQIVLLSGLFGGGFFAATRIARPLLRNVSGLYAARTIEDADPAFQNSLMNYLDLRRHRGDVPASYLAAVEARAVDDLTHIPIESVVNQRRLIQTSYALAAVVVVSSLYLLMTPKSIVDSVKRALLADVVRPTNTRLVDIKPGDDPELSRVVAGDTVPFSVDLQGTRPSRVILHHSVDGGKFFATSDFAPGKNRFDPWTAALPNVQQDVAYYLTGGDAESRRYRLRVLPAPMVTSVSLDLDFPAYTGTPRRANVEGGNIEAIEGTMVTLRARTNQPARDGEIVFDKGKSDLHAAPLAPLSAEATELVGKFRIVKDATYVVKFRTADGKVNPDPVLYDIRALPDAEPQVKFLRPERTIHAASNARVPLVFEATDDHGVKEVLLHVVQGEEPLRQALNFIDPKAPTKRFRKSEILDIAALKVKPRHQGRVLADGQG